MALFAHLQHFCGAFQTFQKTDLLAVNPLASWNLDICNKTTIESNHAVNTLSKLNPLFLCASGLHTYFSAFEWHWVVKIGGRVSSCRHNHTELQVVSVEKPTTLSVLCGKTHNVISTLHKGEDGGRISAISYLLSWAALIGLTIVCLPDKQCMYRNLGWMCR